MIDCRVDVISQYLSPEPLLQSPDFVSAMAQEGMSTQTYAYALNNPIRYVDRNGLCVSGAGVDTALCLLYAGEALEAVALAFGYGVVGGMGASVVNNNTSPGMPPGISSGAQGGSGSTGPLDPISGTGGTGAGSGAAGAAGACVGAAATGALAGAIVSRQECKRRRLNFVRECIKTNCRGASSPKAGMQCIADCQSEGEMNYKACLGDRRGGWQ